MPAASQKKPAPKKRPARTPVLRGGIDLGGTKIQTVVVDAKNKVLGEARMHADQLERETQERHRNVVGNLDSERSVEIVRGRAGDFQVAAQVNVTRVAMALDTGASAVVLTQEAAKAAGLPLALLNYTVQVDTANGRARAAAVCAARTERETLLAR